MSRDDVDTLLAEIDRLKAIEAAARAVDAATTKTEREIALEALRDALKGATDGDTG
jgi:hypothetical protein